MSFNQLLLKAKQWTESSSLDSHEGNIPDSAWKNRIQLYVANCTELKEMLLTGNPQFDVPPAQLIIFLGGILGNSHTSNHLHTDENLKLICEEILGLICSICNVHSTRGLLLLKPNRSTQPRCDNLAMQILRLCVANLARESSSEAEDTLCRAPLFRDALFWLTLTLDYPEIAGEEFVPILQPLGLRLTEDYRPRIQLAGLRLLQNLATKARVADWRQSNRAVAVINQLLEHRLASNPGSSALILEEVHKTLLVMVNLLNTTDATFWFGKLTERALSDLSMESRKIRQRVLLDHVFQLIEVMKTSFALYTRQFVHILSIILLGPRKVRSPPTCLTDNDTLDDDVFLLCLKCLQKFIGFTWPLVCPTLLPEIVPPLVAFTDLKSLDGSTQGSDKVSQEVSHVFNMLIRLEPIALTKILYPLCSTVPNLKNFLPPQTQ